MVGPGISRFQGLWATWWVGSDSTCLGFRVQGSVLLRNSQRSLPFAGEGPLMELNSCTAPELWLPHLLTHEYRTIRIQLTLTRPQKASFRGSVLMGTHKRYAHTPCSINYSIANKTMKNTLLQSPFEAAFSWVALFLNTRCHLPSS